MATMIPTASTYIQEAPENPLPKRDDEASAEDMAADRLARWIDEFILDRDASEDWRDQARKWLNFVAGRQWAEQDMRLMKEQGRIPVTVNLIRPVMQMVAGHEMQAREDIVAFSGEEGDSQIAVVATGAGGWVAVTWDGGWGGSGACG
jgi:hypothetical protein